MEKHYKNKTQFCSHFFAFIKNEDFAPTFKKVLLNDLDNRIMFRTEINVSSI